MIYNIYKADTSYKHLKPVYSKIQFYISMNKICNKKFNGSSRFGLNQPISLDLKSARTLLKKIKSKILKFNQQFDYKIKNE